MGSPVSPRSVEKLAATFSDPNRDRMAIPHAPDEVNFGSIMDPWRESVLGHRFVVFPQTVYC